MTKQFDVAIIGGGPGGYVAAIRAAQCGLSVVCIESEKYADPKGDVRLGGTCLNVGCIPSKALLRSSELYDQTVHGLAAHGITVENCQVDLPTMMRRKDSIVTRLSTGLRALFKKNGITLLQGKGRLLERINCCESSRHMFHPIPSPTLPLKGRESCSSSFKGRESCSSPFKGEAGRGMGARTFATINNADRWLVQAGDESIAAIHVIVATGSRPRVMPGFEVDNEFIFDSTGALSWESVPKHLCIIGAGTIGLELGSVWKRLGAKVTLLETLPDFLPAADPAIAKEAWRLFTRHQGLDIKLGVQMDSFASLKEGEYDRIIVSIGRVPNTEGLNLQCDAAGRIDVDQHCQTNLPNVWAIGDAVRGPMLAHKAMAEGVMVAERIMGQNSQVDYDAIPFILYTHPEIAWIGKTQTQLENEGAEFQIGQAPFMANGRAQGQGETAGFVKLLSEPQTGKILGAHIMGSHASELISTVSMNKEIAALIHHCHAHPTLSETLHEAALATEGRALHL
ncbi:MAG: FAD-dependent oxidoreductase [Rhodocyclaceae bacterium]|nr:FAD-dependent oxidoreductase [Rhodocyclaceae bacterium]